MVASGSSLWASKRLKEWAGCPARWRLILRIKPRLDDQNISKSNAHDQLFSKPDEIEKLITAFFIPMVIDHALKIWVHVRHLGPSLEQPFGGFPIMGVSPNGWFKRENPINMDRGWDYTISTFILVSMCWCFGHHRSPFMSRNLMVIDVLNHRYYYWLVVGPPLWKIWTSIKGWLETQYWWENSKLMATSHHQPAIKMDDGTGVPPWLWTPPFGDHHRLRLRSVPRLLYGSIDETVYPHLFSAGQIDDSGKTCAI